MFFRKLRSISTSSQFIRFINTKKSNVGDKICTEKSSKFNEISDTKVVIRSTSQYEYGPEIQEQMNIQIMNEMFASHSYLSMATYFARNDIGLGGCSGFFLGLSDEEKQHAHKLINYQNTRGGIVEIKEILKPEKTDWTSLSTSLNYSICLENKNTKSLLELYKIAEQYNDLMLMDFLTTEFLHEQMQSLQILGNIMARLKLAGENGLAIYLIDRELKENFPYKNKSMKIYDELGTLEK